MDTYIFDKRKLKKIFTKYGLIFLALFPILLLVHYALRNIESSFTRVFVLALVAGLFIAAIEWLLIVFKNHKENKQASDTVVVAKGALGKNKRVYVKKTKILTMPQTTAENTNAAQPANTQPNQPTSTQAKPKKPVSAKQNIKK